MSKFIILIGFLILSLFSCKSSLLNQTINKKREGYWIEKYTQDSSAYISFGNYKNDDPIKKWKHYKDSKLIKKEKYRGIRCYTRNYFENGKIQSKGETIFDNSTKYAHWYYNGNWDFYDEKGKLTTKRLYDQGKLISETIINN